MKKNSNCKLLFFLVPRWVICCPVWGPWSFRARLHILNELSQHDRRSGSGVTRRLCPSRRAPLKPLNYSTSDVHSESLNVYHYSLVEAFQCSLFRPTPGIKQIFKRESTGMKINISFSSGYFFMFSLNGVALVSVPSIFIRCIKIKKKKTVVLSS